MSSFKKTASDNVYSSTSALGYGNGVALETLPEESEEIKVADIQEKATKEDNSPC